MKMSSSEISAAFGHLPTVISVQEAADALKIPKKTVYEWSSQGRLVACARKRGKRLLILRDKFFSEVFNGSDW
jgi:excisionase family DNA binding protein